MNGNELKFTELNDSLREAIDKFLKAKNIERNRVAKYELKNIMQELIADDFAQLQRAINKDDVYAMREPLRDIYFETLCANHIYYEQDFDGILERAMKKTSEMRSFVMSLDKRENIRSTVKLLSDIDSGGLDKRNIAIIIITIYMISLQYDIDFGKCIAEVRVEDIL